MSARAFVFAAVFALGSAACVDDQDPSGPDDPGPEPDPVTEPGLVLEEDPLVPDDPEEAETFTTFIIDQILSTATDDGDPVDLPAVEDLDQDNPHAYDALFL